MSVCDCSSVHTMPFGCTQCLCMSKTLFKNGPKHAHMLSLCICNGTSNISMPYNYSRYGLRGLRRRSLGRTLATGSRLPRSLNRIPVSLFAYRKCSRCNADRHAPIEGRCNNHIPLKTHTLQHHSTYPPLPSLIYILN